MGGLRTRRRFPPTRDALLTKRVPWAADMQLRCLDFRDHNSPPPDFPHDVLSPIGCVLLPTRCPRRAFDDYLPSRASSPSSWADFPLSVEAAARKRLTGFLRSDLPSVGNLGWSSKRANLTAGKFFRGCARGIFLFRQVCDVFASTLRVLLASSTQLRETPTKPNKCGEAALVN